MFRTSPSGEKSNYPKTEDFTVIDSGHQPTITTVADDYATTLPFFESHSELSYAEASDSMVQTNAQNMNYHSKQNENPEQRPGRDVDTTKEDDQVNKDRAENPFLDNPKYVSELDNPDANYQPVDRKTGENNSHKMKLKNQNVKPETEPKQLRSEWNEKTTKKHSSNDALNPFSDNDDTNEMINDQPIATQEPAGKTRRSPKYNSRKNLVLDVKSEHSIQRKTHDTTNPFLIDEHQKSDTNHLTIQRASTNTDDYEHKDSNGNRDNSSQDGSHEIEHTIKKSVTNVESKINVERITAKDLADAIGKLVGPQKIFSQPQADAQRSTTSWPRNTVIRKVFETPVGSVPGMRMLQQEMSDEFAESTIPRHSSASSNKKWSQSTVAKPVQWKRYDWLVGPIRTWDQISQTSNKIISKSNEPVQIRYSAINESVQDLTQNVISPHQIPVTIPTQFLHLVSQFGQRNTLLERNDNGSWTGITYQDLQQTTEQIASSLISFHMTPGSAVIIAGETSRNMICCLLGCVFAALPVFILDSISDLHMKVVSYIMKHGNVEAIICQSREDILTVVQNVNEFRNLKLLIDLNGTSSSYKQMSSGIRLYSFSSWYEEGKNVTNAAYTSHMNNHLAPNKVAVIRAQYFGVVGNRPTGAIYKDDNSVRCIMFTHDNVVFSSRRVAARIYVKKEHERWITHFDWSQAVLTEILPAILLGVPLYLCQPGSGQAELLKYCAEVQPTMFLTSTAKWKVLVEQMVREELKAEERNSICFRLRKWARQQGDNASRHMLDGSYENLTMMEKMKFHVAEFLVFKRQRRWLGLQKAYNCGLFNLSATSRWPRLFRLSVGHEELDESVKYYLRSNNIPVLSWFWFDELGTVAIQTKRTIHGTREYQALLLEDIISVTETSLISNELEELCFSGRSVFAGYLGDKKYAATKLALEGNYLRSGAQGAKYKHMIFITKQIEEYLVMRSGRTIDFKSIEKRLQTHFPPNVIKDCFVVGNGEKHLVLVVSFLTTLESITCTTFNLSTVNWLTKIGSSSICNTDVLDYKDKALNKELLRIIVLVNSQLHYRRELIISFTILPKYLDSTLEFYENSATIRKKLVSKSFKSYIDEARKKQWKAIHA